MSEPLKTRLNLLPEITTPAPDYVLGSAPATGETGGGKVTLSTATKAVNVKNEVPSGLLNGSNSTFLSAYSFVPESVEVFSNGLSLRRVIDFNTTGNNTVILTFSPASTEGITLNYIKTA